MTDLTGEPEDDLLLGDLRAALAGRAELTETVAARGKESFAWRTIDDDLRFAELTFDSGLQGAGTTRSGASRPRILEFTRVLEIHVFADRVQGYVDPPADVTVEWADGRTSVYRPDDLGSFTVQPVPEGVFRFRCGLSSDGPPPAEETPGRTAAASVVTDWITL